MQVFSIVQWYHFAYMVIAVALLGFGVAGTFLSLFKQWLLERYQTVVPALLFAASAGMSMVVGLSNLPMVSFDIFLLFNDLKQVWRLLMTYLLFFLPFFLAALVIGLSFIKYVAQIGRLYAANLLGSGIGGIVAILLMWLFMPEQLPALVALLPLIAGLLFLTSGSGNRLRLLALLTAICNLIFIFSPPPLIPSEFKALSKTMLLPDARIIAAKNSPYGLVQVVDAPALRHAPGLSLNFQHPVPVRKVLFNNGDWVGSLLPRPHPDSVMELNYTTRALPYATRKPGTVLILDSGAGENIAHAIANGAGHISVVEPNQVVLSLLTNELAAETDSLLFHPAVVLHRTESRTYLMRYSTRFDLIVLPVLGAMGGTAGLNAIQEQYTLTIDAFREMWTRLTADGMISITSWMDYPPRTSLKILATLSGVLRQAAVEAPIDHLVAVRNWGTVTFLLKRTPFTAPEYDSIEAFCHRMLFDPVLLRGRHIEQQESYNQLQDSLFSKGVGAILAGNNEPFYRHYEFNIKPATDKQPYFSQFIRWRNIPSLIRSFGSHSIPFIEVGYMIVILTFFQILIVSAILILLPLFRLGFIRGHQWWILLYFGGIGIGYMFVEMVFIQQFILYFGNPIYATAAVISILLIASGAGSYYSSTFKPGKQLLWRAPALIVLFLMLYVLTLTPILQDTIAFSVWVKLLCLILLVGSVGFVMGFPFPAGLSFLGHQGPQEVPWAWAVNGYFSVISSSLATITAVELGFLWVMIFAALAYCLPVLVNRYA